MNEEEFAKATGLSELAVAAISIYELYLALVEAGFTEAQAMQMMCAVMSSKAAE